MVILASENLAGIGDDGRLAVFGVVARQAVDLEIETGDGIQLEDDTQLRLLPLHDLDMAVVVEQRVGFPVQDSGKHVVSTGREQEASFVLPVVLDSDRKRDLVPAFRVEIEHQVPRLLDVEIDHVVRVDRLQAVAVVVQIALDDDLAHLTLRDRVVDLGRLGAPDHQE